MRPESVDYADPLQALRDRLADRLSRVRRAIPDYAASFEHAVAAAQCIAAPVPLEEHVKAVEFIGKLTRSAWFAARAHERELAATLEVLDDLVGLDESLH